MGKQADRYVESITEELTRRLDEAMSNASQSFSEKVVAYFDGKAAAYRELLDWLAR